MESPISLCIFLKPSGIFFDPSVGFFKKFKADLVMSEIRGVSISSSVSVNSRMFDMKHFVIKDKLHDILRYIGSIQSFANYDRLVGGIVMAKPTESGTQGP